MTPGSTPGAGATPPGGRTGAVRDGKPAKAFPWWLVALLVLLLAAIIALVIYLANRGSGKSTAVAAPVTTTSQAATTPTQALPATSATGAPAGSPSVAGSGAAAAGRQGPLIGGGGAPAQTAAGTSAAGMGYGTVLFASDSAVIDADGQKVIDAAVADLRAKGSTSVTVTGYTDVVGTTPANGDLGKQRADAVTAALQSALGTGVTVAPVSDGEMNPVAPNANPDGSDNPTGRAQNRRAVISAS